jgi:hypothetical protein
MEEINYLEYLEEKIKELNNFDSEFIFYLKHENNQYVLRKKAINKNFDVVFGTVNVENLPILCLHFVQYMVRKVIFHK